MLTRIEIDGFKSFADFGMEVPPFVVILGTNASGKSNLFDAIRFLSRLAEVDLRSAVKGLRGEPYELFRRNPDGKPCTSMSFAVEVLLNPEVRDPWGDIVKITHSRVRYEVTIELRRDERGIERLVVTNEWAKPILRKDDKWRPWGATPSAHFDRTFFKYGRKAPWLSTDTPNKKPIFSIHQETKAGRSRSAEAAESTVLSSITSAEFPHLYALREELRSWRFLQLDPGELRRPSPTTAEDLRLEPDGSNLATFLARIQAETRSETRTKGVLADIAADLSTLIPGVIGLDVEEDERNREYRIDIGLRGGPPFSSRVLSDGTLRILALLAVLHDPQHRGLVCFEEPENGVHPGRLKAMVKRLRELVTDPANEDVYEDEPLTQMVLNSHSPVVLAALEPGEMMFADTVSVVDPHLRSTTRKTRIRPVKPSRQTTLIIDPDLAYVTPFEIDEYLSTANRES